MKALSSARFPAPLLAVASTTSVQVSAAVSVSLFGTSGVVGTVWLRTVIAAVLLLALARPHGLTRRQLASSAALGTAMTANTVLFGSATDRIPLGVTVAIEFCGPLTLAALGAPGTGGWGRRLRWPAVALAGVLVLTRPWSEAGIGGGARTWIGLGLAAAAAVGWASYILLSAQVGSRTPGFAGLAVALCVPALVLAPFGAGPVIGALAGHPAGDGAALLGRAALAGLLSPLAAFALELVALRRMAAAVFGIWMALEPAVGAVVGYLVLGQALHAVQLPGLALVVLAGVATSAGSARQERGVPVEVDVATADDHPDPLAGQLAR
jgi:inner membrane transporter RhtA